MKIALYGGAFLLVFASGLTPPTAEAQVSLQDPIVLSQCPFIHNDIYSFSRFLNLVQTQLQQKINEHQACADGYRAALTDVSIVNDLFNQKIDPLDSSDLTENMLAQTAMDLELEIMGLESINYASTDQGTRYLSFLRTSLGHIAANFVQARSSRIHRRKLFSEARNNLFRAKMFNHLNGALQAFQTLPPNCYEHLDGVRAIVPLLTSTAATITGYSGIANSELIGGALMAATNLSLLLQDLDAKRAFHEIEEQTTGKILACTYHAMKFAACEYKRAYGLSRNRAKILELINLKYKPGVEGDFEEYFFHLQQRDIYAFIFESVAKMGVPVSLDIELVIRYFLALRADPATIPVLPPTPTDLEMTRWLNDVKIRGIIFSDEGVNGRLPLQERVKQALDDISRKKADIAATEEILGENRSFVDLKHELEKEIPEIRAQIGRLDQFLSSASSRVSRRYPAIGAIHSVQRILDKLVRFLSVQEPDPSKYDAYHRKVNTMGADLFLALAEGAVAQTDRQSILVVGRKALDRFDRAFDLIEKFYLSEELEGHFPNGVKYSQFKLNRALQLQLLANHESFTGSNVAHRMEDINAAMGGLTTGFQDEIDRMIRGSMNSQNTILPELQGITAAHMCGLFNDFLASAPRLLPRGRDFDLCKKRYKTLEVNLLVEPTQMAIDYDDPCFYSRYSRFESTQRMILQRLRQRALETAPPSSFLKD